MEKKQTVYFRFPAGSEGAESMKKLVEAITRACPGNGSH